MQIANFATAPAGYEILYLYYKNGNILAEKNGTVLGNVYIYDIGLENLIVGNTAYKYVKNAHGDVLKVVLNSTVLAEYSYDAYGNHLSEVENGIDNPIRYAGYYYDDETGNYYLKNRYYNSRYASFLTEDPYWNVNNMLYGNATDSVIRNVYYPAVVQSGNRFAYCGNNPVAYFDMLGFEKIVVSGGNDGEENFKYNFIETAIKCINDWQKESLDESITWIIADWNYSEQDIANFKEVAESYGVSCLIIDDKNDLFDYINTKNGERTTDLISEMAFFAHGTAFDTTSFVNEGHENDYAIALGLAKESNNNLNIFGSDLVSIDSKSFATNSFTYFGSCRTGAEFDGEIFAQSWADLTGGSVMAPTARTSYYNIYPDNRTPVKKIFGKIFGIKSQREKAREKYGFSNNGCLNYPTVAEKGKWKFFKPNILEEDS